MSERILGVDVSTLSIAVAYFERDKLKHAEVALHKDPIQRLADAAEIAQIYVGSNTIVVPEWPMGRSRYAQSVLDRVLGAFLSGCTYAAWVHHQGLTPTEWKKASLGRGNASKDDVRAFVLREYPSVDACASQNIYDAIAIAHAGRAWWASRKQAA